MFQVYNTVSHNFQSLDSIYSYKILAVVAVMCNVCLQLIYFIHSSLYLLISNSYLAPRPSHAPLVSTSLFSISMSLFLFCYIHWFVVFFRFYI